MKHTRLNTTEDIYAFTSLDIIHALLDYFDIPAGHRQTIHILASNPGRIDVDEDVAELTIKTTLPTDVPKVTITD